MLTELMQSFVFFFFINIIIYISIFFIPVAPFLPINTNVK